MKTKKKQSQPTNKKAIEFTAMLADGGSNQAVNSNSSTKEKIHKSEAGAIHLYDSDPEKYKKLNEMAKEKARSLVQWFFDATDHMQWEEAKGCAEKVCDEILNEGIVRYSASRSVREFWVRVKEEIIDNL